MITYTIFTRNIPFYKRVIENIMINFTKIIMQEGIFWIII